MEIVREVGTTLRDMEGKLEISEKGNTDFATLYSSDNYGNESFLVLYNSTICSLDSGVYFF